MAMKPAMKAPYSLLSSRARSPLTSSPSTGWMNTGITAKYLRKIWTKSGVPRKKLTQTVTGHRTP